MAEFRLPARDERVWVVGHTGTGKSHAGLWLLSHADFDRKPWIVLDFKGEKLVRGIPRISTLALNSHVPRSPGVYRLPYDPRDEAYVENYLWEIWKRGKIGVLVDEGHALPGDGGLRSDAVKAIASQGRSKEIPMIVISQQPSWISRFVKSQADHFYIFHLNSREDYKAIGELVPGPIAEMVEALPERHSLVHDVAKRATFHLRALPNSHTIYDRFDRRMPAGFWADLPERKARG
jgi:hypothetical protein